MCFEDVVAFSLATVGTATDPQAVADRSRKEKQIVVFVFQHRLGNVAKMMDISRVTPPSASNNSSRPPPPKTKSNEEICIHSPDMPRPEKGPISPRRSPLSNSSGDTTPPKMTNKNKFLSHSTHNTPTKMTGNDKLLLSQSTHTTPRRSRRASAGGPFRSPPQQHQRPRHHSTKEEYKSPRALQHFVSPTSLHTSSLHTRRDGGGGHSRHDDVVVDVSEWYKAKNGTGVGGNRASKDRKQRRRHSQPHRRTSSSDVLTCPFMEDALARRIQSLARVFIAKCKLQKLKYGTQHQEDQAQGVQRQQKKEDMEQASAGLQYSQPLQPPAKGSFTSSPLKDHGGQTKQALLDGRSAKMFVNARASDLTMSDFGSVISVQSALTQNTFATYNSAAVSAATHNTDDYSTGEDVSLGSFVANADTLKRQTNQSKDLVNDMLSRSYHASNGKQQQQQYGQKQRKQQSSTNHYSMSNLISPRWDVSSKNKVSAATFGASGAIGAVDLHKSYTSTTSSFHNPCFDPNISTAAIHGGRSSGGFGSGLKIPRRKGSLQNQLEKQRQKLSTSNHDRRRNLLPPIKSMGSQVTTNSNVSSGGGSNSKPVTPRRRTIAIDDEEEEAIGGSEVPLSSMLGGNYDDAATEEEDLSDKIQPLRPAAMSGAAGVDNPVRRPVRTLTPDVSLCSTVRENWREQQEKYGGNGIFGDGEEDDTYEDDGDNAANNNHGKRYDDYCAYEFPPDRKISLNSWSGSTITSAPFMPTAKTTLVQQSAKTMSTTPVKVSLNGGIKIESGEEIILVVQEESPDGDDSDIVSHHAARKEDNLNDSPVKRPQRKLSPVRRSAV